MFDTVFKVNIYMKAYDKLCEAPQLMMDILRHKQEWHPVKTVKSHQFPLGIHLLTSPKRRMNSWMSCNTIAPSQDQIQDP